MKRIISWFLSVAILLSLAACDKAGESQDAGIVGANLAAAPVYPPKISFDDFDKRHERRESNPVSEDTVQAMNRFSYITTAKAFEGIDANSCYSPLSLYYALALAANGAGGTTRDELVALLGIANVSDLSEQCGNLYRRLYTDHEISRLKIANSLWLDHEMDGRKVTFKDSFLNTATSAFYASLFTVDFAGESAGKAMSKWVSKNTNGRIAPEFEVDPNQIMSILNTVFFYDQWIDRFDAGQTKADTFYLENGDRVTCDFMNMTQGSHSFSKGDGYVRSFLGLKGNGSMVFILPDEGTGVDRLLTSPEKIEELFTQGDMKNGKVVWRVPKFGYGSSFTLKDVLQASGITSAFLRNADFSGITDGMAYISDVTQETHISIDENGVQASAFTKIDYAGAAMPEGRAEMILNRPFIYGITSQDGILLFVGVCKNPAAAG